MIKNIYQVGFLLFVALMLSACGAPLRSQAISIAPETQLLLVGENLIGIKISINKKSFIVTKEKVEKYNYGAVGSSNKKIELQHVVRLNVDPGKIQLSVEKEGALLINKKLHFVEGQIREIVL